MTWPSDKKYIFFVKKYFKIDKNVRSLFLKCMFNK